MARKRYFEKVDLNPNSFDLTKWPDVLIDVLNEQDKAIFLKRRQAVEMFISNEKATLKDIKKYTGIGHKELYEFLDRCFAEDSNGTLWGYRALIPNKTLKKYERKNTGINGMNVKLTGAFTYLLTRYPVIKEMIDNYFLQRTKKLVTDPKIRIKDLHKKFINLCRSLGLSINDYPFNTVDMGQRSLYRYIKELEINHPTEAAKRYGEDVSRLVIRTGAGTSRKEAIVRPFQRVEFDGHAIDVAVAIKFKNIHGDEYVKVMNRIWLLAIIDVATRTILGHHLYFSSQYASIDVLQCIRNSIVPWIPKEFSIPGLKYPEKVGYVSGVIPEAKWALWNEFCVDNAKANLASMVINRLTDSVGCAVNAGPVSTPERRPLIEGFFKLLEENGYHRLVNTTGNNPKDPRRKNPEENAIMFQITSNEIEQLTEILVAEYNCTPNKGLNYLSPLEAMEQRIICQKMLPNVLAEEKRRDLVFMSFTAKRKIGGNLSQGRRPYITFEGVEYRSELLARSFNLIGQELELLVNIEDLRVIRAYLCDGSELGFLTASGKWGITPHTLQMRKQINSLRNRKLIHYTNSDDPIEIFHAYLKDQAVERKNSRNKLANLQRYSKQMKTNDVKKQQIESAPCTTPNSISSAIKPLEEGVEKLRQMFGTITF